MLGTADGLEARLVPEHGLPLALVPRVPLPRRPTPDWFRLPGRLRAAVRAAGDAIDEAGAQVVVGFGGYVSTPAYLAARRRGMPVVMHEQNARPGLANRLGARWATHGRRDVPRHARCAARRSRACPCGADRRPGRRSARADRGGQRAAAAAELGLDPERPTLS